MLLAVAEKLLLVVAFLGEGEAGGGAASVGLCGVGGNAAEDGLCEGGENECDGEGDEEAGELGEHGSESLRKLVTMIEREHGGE